MHRIIGTAGHIDHGKTSLIKALTGQDTDRLKEEKERGISIDLGFAYLDLPDGTRAGIVDVPGHERFIRNMLAGAHGMDLVLFVVAADDGVMPQTEEHLDIVRLLGVQQALFVVTKADMVPEARIEEVTEEIRALAAGTMYEHSSAVPFSSTTGRGLEDLRTRIFAALQTGDRRREDGYYRLPVDRAFVVQGHGLVVTGTTVSGEVRIGDRVLCLPAGHDFRVRNIHVHNEPVDVASCGQRTALNLSGTEKMVPVRGDVICDERFITTTDRFDARLELRRSIPDGIASHQRIRVYAGTAERLGKVIVLGPRDEMKPGETAYCQIVVSDPLFVLRRDRFIIRDESAQRTLGGGIVLHPSARRHSRNDSHVHQRLEALDKGDVAAVVEAFLTDTGEFAVSLDRLRQFLNLREEESRVALEQVDGLRTFAAGGDTWYARGEQCERLEAALLELLASFHATHALAQGMDVEETRARVAAGMPAEVFRSFLEALTGDEVIVREGKWLRLPGHHVELQQADADLAERVKVLLAVAPLAPPDLKHMGETLEVDRQRLMEVVRVMEREQSIVRLSSDLYFLRESIEAVESELRRHFAEGAPITPGNFRDLLGTTRKYAIPLLEYFDRKGVTVRTSSARHLRSPSAERVGEKG